MVRAPLAWPISAGAGVKVEIIDTGMEPHEDLPTLLPENCSGSFGGCSDGPEYFHGTHVSGILVGRDNSVGVVGAANGVESNLVYLWRACDAIQCSIPQIVAGIDAGIAAGVRVINMSFGGQLFSQSVANAVAAAWNTGSMVLVAAAGNLESIESPHSNHYPAAHTNVIGVSGVRTDGTFAATSPCPDVFDGSWKSNQGTHVDLAAPFWALSTVQNNLYEDEIDGWCGTSMATPHVSATAALLWSQNPTWTNAQVVNRLSATASDRGAAGRDDLYGYGLVDAAAAVGYVPPPPPGPTSVTVSGPSLVDGCTPATWTAWTASTTGGVPPITFEWTVEGRSFATGTSNQLPYTNSGQSLSIFITAIATDSTGGSKASSPFKTNIRLPGACEP